MPQKAQSTKRLSPAKLQKAKDGLTSLGQLSGYNPQRKDYSSDNIKSLADSLRATGDAEIAAQNALAKARDAAAKAAWDAYNFMQGAAEQVMGQYGSEQR